MDDMTVVEYGTLTTADSLVAKPVRKLTEINSEILKGLAAAAELFGLLEEPAERDEGHHEPGRLEGRVRLEGVRFRYAEGQPEVLKGIDLEVAAGEMIAIVGRSGSGKSTLVGLLPRFYRPTEGRVLIDDVPLDDYRLAPLRRQIALVSQQVTLFNASIADNIAYGVPDADPAAIEAAARAAQDRKSVV